MFAGQDKKKTLKAGVDLDRAPRRREEMSLSLRTKKRDDLLEKRRKAGEPPAEETLDTTESVEKLLQQLPQMVHLVNSTDTEEQCKGTLLIRKLLSVESNPPIDNVIHAGVLPRLVEFLHQHDNPTLQFEAAWALTNVASGTSEHTMAVIQSGAVPLFVQLLSSPNEDVREQSVWALGNIAGDSARCRDYILGLEVVSPLMGIVAQPGTKISMVRNAIWAVSNLCRGKPVPDMEKVGVLMPMLVSLLNHHDDEVLADACWALSYLSDGPNERIQNVIESGAVPRLVSLLATNKSQLQTPAIRTIGNIVTGSDTQTQTVVNQGALPNFHYLLASSKRNIRKEVCWTISNVTAGTREQIQAVIETELIPAVIKQLVASEFEVRKEAAWAVSNLTAGGTHEQIHYLVSQNVIPPLCDLLSVFDAKIIMVALEALDNILRVGKDVRTGTVVEGTNMYAQQVIECGGLSKIDELQSHNSDDVYNQCLGILENYFESEGGDMEPDPSQAHGFEQSSTEGQSAEQPRFHF